MAALLELGVEGPYCAGGDFYIDPWHPVSRAVITHAHADHARPGCGPYLVAERGAALLRERLGPEAPIEPLAYGRTIRFNHVALSLHPAGHVLGSAQVRVERGGEVWVFTGDYKRQADATCDPFEPLRCHTLITESSFGLPIFRWRPPEEVFAEINAWWAANQCLGRTGVLFAYALGKAQRLLAGVDASIEPIIVHGAVARFLPAHEAAGVRLAAAEHGDSERIRRERGRALVIAALGRGLAVAAKAGRSLDCVRFRLDANSRNAPAPEPRPRLRALGSR